MLIGRWSKPQQIPADHPQSAVDLRRILTVMMKMATFHLAAILSAVSMVHGQRALSNYCAQIVATEANQTVGYVAMQINAGMASYSYSLDLSKSMIKTTCDLSAGLTYHIHTSWNNLQKNSAVGGNDCGNANCGLHYDPNLACGYTSAPCTLLGRTSAASYNCTPASNTAGQYSQCQIGDLSGKFGMAKSAGGLLYQQLTPLYDYQPPYVANYLKAGSAGSSMFSSVVFHCNNAAGSRLVCAKFQLVPAGQSSVCPFPAATADAMATLSSDLSYNKAVVSKAVIAIIVLAVFLFVSLFIVGLLAFLHARKPISNTEKETELKTVKEIELTTVKETEENKV